MGNSIKVNIGGREYSLRGDDEQTIRDTANLVNTKYEDIVSQHGDLPDKTISVLASLNIAEESLNYQRSNLATQEVLITELDKMTDFLENLSS